MTSNRTVLLIDDDVDIRTSVAEALEEEGWRVHVAETGDEGLRLLAQENGARPDVILLDLMMPVMDGWAFRAEQDKLGDLADIPVVVFTAYDLPGDAMSRLRPAGVLKKPVRLEHLLHAVESVLSSGAAPTDPH